MKMIKQLKIRFGLKNITLAMMLFYVYKRLRQFLVYRSSVEKVVCPIFACQRSGTSLMLRVFFWDMDNVVYREGSVLSSDDPLRLRLNPWPQVVQKIRSDRAPLVILKPIVESQNASRFLEEFPEARSIWLYRHYLDVVASNLRKFGERNGIDDIRPIAQDSPDNWRSEKVSDYTRSVIREHFSEEMSIYDAAALFWFARNQLFFDQNLDTNPRVLPVRYRDFVNEADHTMHKIYEFLQRPYPGDHILREVHGLSVGKGSDVVLSPEIESLCEDMLARLDAVRQAAVV
jgi:hypothetical protein